MVQVAPSVALYNQKIKRRSEEEHRRITLQEERRIEKLRKEQLRKTGKTDIPNPKKK